MTLELMEKKELPILKNLDTIHIIKGKRYLFSVETSQDMDDYQKYEDLRQEIWKDPGDQMASVRNMRGENYFDKGSTILTGVFVEAENGSFPKERDHFVGFSYGFVGVRDKELGFRSSTNFIFYSKYLAVKKGYQDLGLGVLIKLFQKEVVLKVCGLETITCTYDPLTGVNARRNIHRFGMKVLDYREAYYQDFSGELNRIDVPSDRLFVSWNLMGDIRRSPYDLQSLVNSDHLVIRSETSEVQGRSGLVRLEIVANIRTDWDQEYALIEIPFDFYTMLKQTDVPDEGVSKIPLDWRLATREVFQKLFERKYKVIDFCIYQDKDRKRDFYVLKK
jgi:predicted GNAT superfamily acetyltransferase